MCGFIKGDAVHAGIQQCSFIVSPPPLPSAFSLPLFLTFVPRHARYTQRTLDSGRCALRLFLVAFVYILMRLNSADLMYQQEVDPMWPHPLPQNRVCTFHDSDPIDYSNLATSFASTSYLPPLLPAHIVQMKAEAEQMCEYFCEKFL